MKNSLSILILLTFVLVNQLYTQKPVKVKFEGGNLERSGSWTTIFKDEFAGNTLDTSLWYTYYPYGPGSSDQCSFCRTHDTVISQQIYLDKNLKVNNGNLEIITLNEQCSWMGFNSSFSTGLVHSKRTFNNYYKYEIRCRITEGTIFWPAFWMFGWSTEIDVFEFMSTSTKDIFFNVHKWSDGKSFNKSKKYKGVDFAKDFHTYSVEYDPNFVNYFIDQKLVHQIPKYVKKNGKYIKKRNLKQGEYYLNPAFPATGDEIAVIVNNAVSTPRAFKRGELSKNTFPAIMYVDYIRVYQKSMP